MMRGLVILLLGLVLSLQARAQGGGDSLAQFGPTSSAQLRSIMTDSTGTGALVFGTSPALTTPNLGTPSALNLSNALGLPLNTAGAVTGQLPGAYGGTGVNNSGKTITLGGNFTTSGAYNSTFIVSGSYSYTFPGRSATLASKTGTFTAGNLLTVDTDGQIVDSNLTGIGTVGADAFLLNPTSGTAAPIEVAFPACSSTGKALTYTAAGGVGAIGCGTFATLAANTFTAAQTFSTTASIGGASLTLTTGALGLSKMTASGSAPGAAGGKLELVCGTNAGTAKLTVSAGTSSTPATVLDNIGSGVTGC
jgi:hypothetical protein